MKLAIHNIVVFFFTLATLLTPFHSQARIAGTPFKPEVDKRFHQLEATTGDFTFSLADPNTNAIGAGKVTEAQQKVISADGLHSHRIARATWDFATDGGAISAIPNAAGVTLPAKALITRSWIYVTTQIVDAGSGTMAISCEDANNIKTATDLTGTAAGGFIEGASTGAISAAVGSIAAACVITFTIAGAAATAGKITVFVEYVVSP